MKHRSRKKALDIEEQANIARAERQKKTAIDVNALLEQRNCRLAAFVRAGEQLHPIDQILALPVVVLTISN
jgi:hypothetical protein